MTGRTSSLISTLIPMLPPEVRESLSRAAVPRTFDAETYADRLRTDGGPELSLLVQLGQVETAPGEPLRYRLVPAGRDALLAEWWTAEGRPASPQLPVPGKLRDLARELARVAHRQARSLEELDLCLIAEPAKAVDLFYELYDPADRVHELARCRAVLDVLERSDLRPLLGPTLARLRNDTASYLAARTFWADDYHRSARYVPRTAPEAALEDLLAGRGPRILQLYARGGMGKSMQLRWFIARRCAPAPTQVPCGRIDMDDIRPAVAARHPWLLLLEAAAQLDRQAPGAPFQELLATHGHYRTMLDPKTTGATLRTATAADGEDVEKQFCSTLNDRTDDRPVVIVLDTVEEILRPAVDPRGIVALIDRVTAQVRDVRFVLAGRFDLCERLEKRHIPVPELTSHELAPLTAEEQDRYLVEIRKITDPAAVLQIRGLSDGLTISLALYADLVTRMGVSPADLVGERSPGIATAITRVVKRVTDRRLRWLLRYGVIPRRLSFAFVEQVMWPYLAAGMAGLSTADDPSRDERAHGGDPVFQTDLEPPADIDDLRRIWYALREYAADYGWVTLAPDGCAEFRTDVVGPLRELLRPHSVFALLQADAAGWFAGLAVKQPESWLRWTIESIFHLLQADPDAGAAAWRDAVSRARADGREDWCLELADDLLGRDFVRWNGEPIAPMTHQLLAEAHLERARAAAGQAEQDGLRDIHDDRSASENPLWSDVDVSLAAARILAERTDVTLPEIDLVVLAASLAIARGDLEAAQQALRGRAAREVRSEALADTERALGVAMARAGRLEAARHLATSYRLALETGDRAGARLSALQLTASHYQRDAFTAARDTIRGARAAGVLAPDDDEAALLESPLLTQCGAPEEGIAVAESVLGRGVRRAEAHLMIAIGWLMLDELDAARKGADDALDQSADELEADVAADALGVRGYCALGWGDHGAATRDFLAAAARARAARDLDRVAEWTAACAFGQLDLAGDLRGAAQSLDEARRSDPRRGSNGWAAERLGRVLLEHRRGDQERAVRLLNETVAVLDVTAAEPATQIDAAIAGIAVCQPSDTDRWWAALVEHLSAVTPEGARLLKLGWFDRLPSPSAAPHPRAAEVLALVGGGSGDVPAMLRWTLAEVLRVAGRPADAERMLAAARCERRNDDLIAWWRWIDGMQRIGPADADEPVPPDAVLDEGPSMLRVFCQVTLARRRLGIDGPAAAERRLDAADALLAARSERSRWRAEAALGRAEVAQARGDSTAAKRAAAEAVTVHGLLGATPEREAIARWYGLGERSRRHDLQVCEIRFREPDEHGLRVSVRFTDAEEKSRVVPPSVLGDLSPGRLLARVRWLLEPLRDGWEAWSAEVAERILVPDLARLVAPPPGEERDLRLVVTSRDIAALPWELCRAWDSDQPLVRAAGLGLVYRSSPSARREEAKTRAAQEALARIGRFPAVPDGLVGSVTRTELRAFQHDHGLPANGVPGRRTFAALRAELATHLPKRPLRVVVLRPDPVRQLERRRGDVALGSELLGTYVRHGAAVAVLDDVTVGMAHHYGTGLFDGPPDVIHLAAPIRLSSGATVVDLGGDAAARGRHGIAPEGAELTVSALREVVLALMGGRRAPLVVIDVPLPGTLTETLRAVGLRNSLAHQLMAMGAAQSILATGLAGPGVRDDVIGVVVGGLTAGKDVAEMVRDVHRLGRPDVLADAVACLATAVHLERPPFSLFPVWAS